MSKIFLLFVLIGSSMLTCGTTYHVATTGSDSNPGTESEPFVTIDHAADTATPGDTVIIHAGTYRETVTPANSGEVGVPITFQAATGETPVISGCDVVSDWSLDHDAVYSADMAWDLGRGLNQVFVDGVWLPEAQWPAQTNIFRHVNDFYAPTAGSCNATTAAISDSVNLTQPDGYWDGATALLNWSPRYHAITAIVASYTSGELALTFDSTSWSGTITSYGIYALYGHTNAMFAGSWWYDSSAGRMRLWLANGADPSGHTVEAKRRTNGFNLSGKSFITLSGVHFKACDLITDTTSTNISISNVEFLFPTHYTVIDYGLQDNGNKGVLDSGVILKGQNHTLANSTVLYSAGNGVALLGTNCIVTNCVIGFCNYGYTEASGVHLGGAVWASTYSLSNQVVSCTITNTGRSNINITKGRKVKVLHNQLGYDIAGAVCWDTGVVYGNASDWDGAEIAYNRVLYHSQYGLYLDNASTNATIHHNILNPEHGYNDFSILVNSSCGNISVFNNFGGMIDVAYLETGNAGCLVKNNIAKRLYISALAEASNNINMNDLSESARNALFVDYVNGNYHPVSTAASIVDAGADVGLTLDFDGRSMRGTPDIGPYEYWPPARAATLRVNSIQGR